MKIATEAWMALNTKTGMCIPAHFHLQLRKEHNKFDYNDLNAETVSSKPEERSLEKYFPKNNT